MDPGVVIGLSAVVMAVRDGEAAALTVRQPEPVGGELAGLPFGPFDPQGHRTFELALRAFVQEQTGFELGYVEQLYTFGDKGRDAPLADVGAGSARIISVGYLALTPGPLDLPRADTSWRPWPRAFPWEDWRNGRPEALDAVIAPALRAWVDEAPDRERPGRSARVSALFALGGCPWNEERVLERYEMLYEAGLAPEADRDRALGRGSAAPKSFDPALGEPMVSDHRRILATALGRLRGKLKYRPVVFELMPREFTLSELQRTVEAISGVALHKQNFRRMVERTGFVEGSGRLRAETGGRPAELFRYRREVAAGGPAAGFSLPQLREP